MLPEAAPRGCVLAAGGGEGGKHHPESPQPAVPMLPAPRAPGRAAELPERRRAMRKTLLAARHALLSLLSCQLKTENKYILVAPVGPPPVDKRAFQALALNMYTHEPQCWRGDPAALPTIASSASSATLFLLRLLRNPSANPPSGSDRNLTDTGPSALSLPIRPLFLLVGVI